MSTIIRDVKIRVGIEQMRSGGSAGLSESRRATEEATRVTREHTEAIRESGAHYEAFGRKALKGFEHAAHGTIQLARGIALMTASGEEDIKKLVQSFLAIEAAVDIVKGGGKLLKVAKDFEAVGVVVAAVGAAVAIGTVAWRNYTAVIEETAEALKKVRAEQDAAGKAERERQHAAEHRERQGRADLTNSISDPQERRKAQEAELKYLQKRLDEREALGKNTENDISRREGKVADLKGRAARASDQAGMNDKGEFVKSRAEYEADAAREEAGLKQAKEERRKQVELQISDLDRGREIKVQQREDKLEQNRLREQNELSNIRATRESESPLAKKRREDASFMFENFQKQAIANGYSMMGYGNAATVWQGSNVNGWEEERTRGNARNEATKIREEGDSAVQAILQVLNSLKDELARFETKSDSGKTE